MTIHLMMCRRIESPSHPLPSHRRRLKLEPRFLFCLTFSLSLFSRNSLLSLRFCVLQQTSTPLPCYSFFSFFLLPICLILFPSILCFQLLGPVLSGCEKSNYKYQYQNQTQISWKISFSSYRTTSGKSKSNSGEPP